MYVPAVPAVTCCTRYINLLQYHIMLLVAVPAATGYSTRAPFQYTRKTSVTVCGTIVCGTICTGMSLSAVPLSAVPYALVCHCLRYHCLRYHMHWSVTVCGTICSWMHGHHRKAVMTAVIHIEVQTPGQLSKYMLGRSTVRSPVRSPVRSTPSRWTSSQL